MAKLKRVAQARCTGVPRHPCKNRHTVPCCPYLAMHTYAMNDIGRLSGGPNAPHNNHRNNTVTLATGARGYGNFHLQWESRGPTPMTARELPIANNPIYKAIHSCIHLPSPPKKTHTNKIHSEILQGCPSPHCPPTSMRRGPSTHNNPKQRRGLHELSTRGSGAKDDRRPFKQGVHTAYTTNTTRTEHQPQLRPEHHTTTEITTNLTICKPHNGRATRSPASTRTKPQHAYKVEADVHMNSHRDYTLEPRHNLARGR